MANEKLGKDDDAGGIEPSSKSRSKKKPTTRPGRDEIKLLSDVLKLSQPKPKWKLPNAQKHGAFAEKPVMLGEDSQEFEELFSGLIDEWQPSGPTEDEAVFSLASDMWRKRRAQRVLQAKLVSNTLYEPDCPTFNEFYGLFNFQPSIVADPENAFEKDAGRYLRADKINHLKNKVPRSKYKTAAEWARAIVTEIMTVLIPQTMPDFVEPEPNDPLQQVAYLQSVQ